VIKVMCFLRLHLWKKKCCSPRNGKQQIHSVSGVVLSQGHPLRPRKNARLKLLTLSYFNHTAGRRFLPFGLSTLPLSVD
jgi:hypothetical protein